MSSRIVLLLSISLWITYSDSYSTPRQEARRSSPYINPINDEEQEERILSVPERLQQQDAERPQSCPPPKNYAFVVEDLQRQLNKSHNELDKSRSELNKKHTELISTRNELNKQRTELDTTRAKLDKKSAELNTTRTELGNKHNELTTTRNELGKKQNEIAAIRTELGKKHNELAATRAELGKKQNELVENRTELDKKQNELIVVKADLGKKHNDLMATRAELDRKHNELIATRADLDRKHNELITTRIKLDKKQNELEAKHVAYLQEKEAKEKIQKDLQQHLLQPRLAIQQPAPQLGPPPIPEVGPPPPPQFGPPPPPQFGPPPPPQFGPPPPPQFGPPPLPGADRGGLLAAIRGGKKLKKVDEKPEKEVKLPLKEKLGFLEELRKKMAGGIGGAKKPLQQPGLKPQEVVEDAPWKKFLKKAPPPRIRDPLAEKAQLEAIAQQRIQQLKKVPEGKKKYRDAPILKAEGE